MAHAECRKAPPPRRKRGPRGLSAVLSRFRAPRLKCEIVQTQSMRLNKISLARGPRLLGGAGWRRKWFSRGRAVENWSVSIEIATRRVARAAATPYGARCRSAHEGWAFLCKVPLASARCRSARESWAFLRRMASKTPFGCSLRQRNAPTGRFAIVVSAKFGQFRRGMAKGAQPSWLRSLPTFCRITESRSPRGSSGGEERD